MGLRDATGYGWHEFTRARSPLISAKWACMTGLPITALVSVNAVRCEVQGHSKCVECVDTGGVYRVY